MTTVSDVCSFLEVLAPLQFAEPWDNVGLLLGRSDRPVRSIMTCLTLTHNVAQEAIQRSVDLIVTHHPVLFRGVKRITAETPEGQLILDLAEMKIAVFSPHTAFDSATKGINQSLAAALGLNGIQALRSSDAGPGSGRFGTFDDPISREQFLQKVCESVDADFVEYAWNGSKTISKVAVACGSAIEFLDDAINASCDTMITGEARFHGVLECQARKINLILTGHYYSERPAVVELASRLAGQFSELAIFASQQDKDPLERFSRLR